MINFIKRNKKKILKVLGIIAVLYLISFAGLAILWGFDVVYFDDGIKLNYELFNKYANSWYGWLIFILLQVSITIFICFVPGCSMACIILTQTLFEVPLHAFLISFISVLIASTIMYTLGRFGGYKICEKMLGEKDCERASYLLNHQGAVYFPLMMLFPVFPDEALIMIAGTLKMKLRWFIPSIVIGRGVGIAAIVFGLGSIPYDKFTTIWHWIGFITLCAVVIIGVFYGAHKFNKYLERRNERLSKNE